MTTCENLYCGAGRIEGVTYEQSSVVLIGKGEKTVKKLLRSLFTSLMLGAFASQGQSQPAKSTETFASFWTQFKAAVGRNDKEAVASMTRFPFHLEAQITRDQFIKKYRHIFNRRIQRCFANEKPVRDRENYAVFCGREIYAFEKVDGKYKFTEIGAND